MSGRFSCLVVEVKIIVTVPLFRKKCRCDVVITFTTNYKTLKWTSLFFTHSASSSLSTSSSRSKFLEKAQLENSYFK